VIRGEGQRGEHHVFDILAVTSVVFGGGVNPEISVEEENEVLGVLVAFQVLLLKTDRFVQLRLHVCSGMEGGEVQGVRGGPVAGVQMLGSKVFGEIGYTLLVCMRVRVRVCVHSEEKFMRSQVTGHVR